MSFAKIEPNLSRFSVKMISAERATKSEIINEIEHSHLVDWQFHMEIHLCILCFFVAAIIVVVSYSFVYYPLYINRRRSTCLVLICVIIKDRN